MKKKCVYGCTYEYDCYLMNGHTIHIATHNTTHTYKIALTRVNTHFCRRVIQSNVKEEEENKINAKS